MLHFGGMDIPVFLLRVNYQRTQVAQICFQMSSFMCEYGLGRGRKVHLVQLYWTPHTAGYLLISGIFSYRLLRSCWFILV